MPQRWVGRSRVTLWRAVAAVLLLAMLGGTVQLDPGRGADRAVAATAAAAARLALAGDEAARPVASTAAYVESLGGNASWQTGTVALPADDAADRFEPRVYVYVAHRQDDGQWTAALEGTAEFQPLATEALAVLSGTVSGDLLATTVQSSGSGSAALSLPWATGKAWRLTGGPHHFRGGGSRPWSSLDFAGPTPGVSTKVRAARGGVVVRPCANLVQIRHGDGWTTSYYHLKNIAVRAGQSINRGQVIGYTSKRAGCGGYATGKHVHFSLLKSGSYVNIRGHAIGGWTVKEGSSSYKGCLIKGDKKRCAPNGSIYNNGSVGDGD